MSVRYTEHSIVYSRSASSSCALIFVQTDKYQLRLTNLRYNILLLYCIYILPKILLLLNINSIKI